MKKEIKFAVLLIAAGMGLVAYAHANFATKDIVTLIFNDISEIKQDIRYIRENR